MEANTAKEREWGEMLPPWWWQICRNESLLQKLEVLKGFQKWRKQN